jgi:hypothetical protein
LSISAPYIPIEQVVLERLRYAVTGSLGAAAAADLRVSTYPEYLFDGLVYQLTVDVLAEKLVDEVLDGYFPLPANGWQLFKEQHMPAWFIKRYPVKTAWRTCRVEYKKHATYPRANIVLPKDKFGRVVLRESVRTTLTGE